MSLPVIKKAQMLDWEKASWAAGKKEAEVIRRVGERVARRALQLTRSNDLILLLAGKGHNGDDARAVQEFLPERRVELLNVTSPVVGLPQLELALGANPALVIDGLFGVGLDRPLDADWIAFITRLNGVNPMVLALDVPSGLDADTGQPLGAAVQATVTLTVGAPKVGLLRHTAAPFVGRLELVADIGLTECLQKSELYWTQAEDVKNFPPPRPAAGHKGTFGHLAIIAGSVGYHGAAVLAARGAQRAQPGLITVFAHEPAYFQIAGQLQAPMVAVWRPEFAFPADFSAVLVGPGLAGRDVPEDMKTVIRKLWRDSPGPVVADASALDWLPQDHVPKNAIRVVTPHPGEAGRMSKSTAARVQENRPLTVREVSKRHGGCWVVLKGQNTLIGRAAGEIFINSTGNPHLAQGGSGDVLAGFLAGLLAQPILQTDVARTLRYAVWQHGAAADALQSARRNWTTEDLFAELGNIV